MIELNKRIFTSIALLIILYISLINNIFLSIILSFIVFIALVEFHNIFLKIFKKKKIENIIYLFLALIYLVFFYLITGCFLFYTGYENKALFIFILSICIATDIGGYTFGKLLKGKKITKISPNKTYAGMFGSFILSFIVTLIFFSDLNLILNSIYLALIISFFSQIGDLIISFLKRKAKIKDTGGFLPGHGGLLDRLDGILLAVPIGIILVSL